MPSNPTHISELGFCYHRRHRDEEVEEEESAKGAQRLRSMKNKILTTFNSHRDTQAKMII